MSLNLGDYAQVAAPKGTRRLIPSRFPPIPAFEDVCAPNDLEAVMFLEGWTNDRLVAPRLKRLAREEQVFGRENASIVMAAFLHGSPSGLRFSDASLGAWYGATDQLTAVLEVANGLRKEIALSALTSKAETYREYRADLGGAYLDIIGKHPEFHTPDDASYAAPQAFGRMVRALGPGAQIAGIRYESVRHKGHENWVCFRPTRVLNVVQADHLRIEVPEMGAVIVRRMA